MKNWLNQDIEEGSVVYRGNRQGVHGDKIGIVTSDLGDNRVMVNWLFELRYTAAKIDVRCAEPGAILVRVDDSVLASLYRN